MCRRAECSTGPVADTAQEAVCVQSAERAMTLFTAALTGKGDRVRGINTDSGPTRAHQVVISNDLNLAEMCVGIS